MLSLALVLVMIITARILVQNRTVDREIAKLAAQVEKVKKNNDELSSLVKYLNTPEYQEKEAREKLSLRKDGEYVVVLPESDQSIAGAGTEKVQEANYKKWFNYFFSHE